MTSKKTSLVMATTLALSITLAGCAGREARPVALTNPTDSVMDCAGITREFHGNERQILSTMKERNAAQGKNVALGVTSVVFFPALFFMDPKSPERVEIEALRNRNGVLQDMAANKRCPAMQSQLANAYKQLDDAANKQRAND